MWDLMVEVRLEANQGTEGGEELEGCELED
jgi:hypothetical protein